MSLSELFSGEPAFARRGYMLDVSRDRVPTRETLAWLVEVLATLRFTELQLYVEHTFAYTGHDAVWSDASPLTTEDMAWLRDVAAERSVELVANMNGFGHMARWLQHDEYRPLAECPDGASDLFGSGVAEPTCLEPTEQNAAFAVALAREMLDAVGGNRIHIGGDEPFELGECRSAGRVAEVGRDRVYLDHLRRIIEPLAADGNEVLFWADLFRRDPTLMGDIPASARGVVWNYEAPSETSWAGFLTPEVVDKLGLPDDANRGFVAHARLFVESGTPFWVAPGTGTWNTLIGRNLNAAANVIDAAVVGSANGAEGYLLTDWGDNGHWQSLAVSLPSLIRGAAAAWSGGSADVEVGPIIDDLLQADTGTGALLDNLGGLGESLGISTPNSSPIFVALVDSRLPITGEPDAVALGNAGATVSEAVEVFSTQPIGHPRGGTIAAEMLAACGLAKLGLRRLGGDEPDAAEFAAAAAAQHDAWLLSSRPGGLEDSLARLRR